MTEKQRLCLSDIFDIEIVLHDGNYYYELEFEGYVLDGFTDAPIRAVLGKQKRIPKKRRYMSNMIICGLSMEMEMAKEMGWIGKCRGCLYCDTITNFGLATCQKKGKVNEKENCEDWIVDHR